MTDIVERLRFKKELKTPEDVHVLFADAADEIERLREALRKIAKSQLSDSEQAYIFKMLARAALGEEE